MKSLAQVLYFLGLSIWVGGLATLALLVAPVVFHKAPSRAVAGEIFGAALRAFSYVEIVCAIFVAGGGMAVALATRPIGGSEPAKLIMIGVLVLVFCVYTFYLHPTIAKVREQCGDFDRDPETDEQRTARERFGGLHRWSERLVGANIFLGLALLVFSITTLPTKGS